jgi:hypothetical protein
MGNNQMESRSAWCANLSNSDLHDDVPLGRDHFSLQWDEYPISTMRPMDLELPASSETRSRFSKLVPV